MRTQYNITYIQFLKRPGPVSQTGYIVISLFFFRTKSNLSARMIDCDDDNDADKKEDDEDGSDNSIRDVPDAAASSTVDDTFYGSETEANNPNGSQT